LTGNEWRNGNLALCGACFVTRTVGQRLIKQTVLFDGAAPIHRLYYANKNAEIGSVMTTFPFRQAGLTGRRGSGQVKKINCERSSLKTATRPRRRWAGKCRRSASGDARRHASFETALRASSG
jgi:hypothetical protein